MRSRIPTACLTGLVWLAMSLATATASAQSPCGLNSLDCLEGGSNPVGYHDSTDCSDATRHASAGYDLRAGTLDVTTTSLGSRANATVRANDQYQITGLPPGTPVSFFVELEVSGFISPSLCGADGFLSAAFMTGVPGAPSAGAQYACDATCTCFGVATLSTVIRLPLTKNAGALFALGYFVSANGVFSNTTLHGQFRFSGLPASAAVVSCQGFVQTGPVAAQRVSWGALKQHYR